jgi:hypothetical protein
MTLLCNKGILCVILEIEIQNRRQNVVKCFAKKIGTNGAQCQLEKMRVKISICASRESHFAMRAEHKMFSPNPHCFITIAKKLLVAEKSHYYPTPCTALCG